MKASVGTRESDRVIYRFGDFRLDATRRLLLAKTGESLPVASRAFDALLLFVRHPDELLDKSTLMKAVWPNAIVEENNLNQHISALRKLLGETPGQHRFIVTIPGRGYRFVAPVSCEMEGAPATAAPFGAAPAAELEAAPAIETSPGPVAAHEGDRKAQIRPGLAVAIAASALLLAVGVWMWQSHWGERVPQEAIQPHLPAHSTRLGTTTPRLAILPLEDLSPNPQDAFFAEGLHEELLTTIAERIPGVQVISRTTMLGYRQNSKPVSMVASELSATHVIEGSVRREGQHVRLTVQLIDAKTDGHLWAKSYDRTLSSALTLESEIAQEVAAQLSPRLSALSTTTQPMTRDTEAYDLYLKAVVGLRELDAGSPVNDYNSISDLLTQAIARDPTFALAYAQRARLGTLMFVANIISGEDHLALIRRDLADANRLAAEDPVVLAVNGFFLMGIQDNERALALMSRAEAAGITDPMYLLPKTRLLLRLSRTGEVAPTHDRMLGLDPSNPIVLGLAVADDSWLHRPEEALRIADLMGRVEPIFREALRGFVLFAYSGETTEWRASFNEFTRDSGGCPPDPQGIRITFDLLRYERRYQDMNACLRKITVESIRYPNGWSTILDSVGEFPIAGYRGWSAMLLGDQARAQLEGRNVLSFVARHKLTPYNRVLLGLLEAEANTFLGQANRAVLTARASLELAPRSRDAVTATAAGAIAARVFAWNSAHEEAAALLDELSTSTPGLPPAEITRDPLYTIPLASDAHFRKLSARLEAQMRSLHLH